MSTITPTPQTRPEITPVFRLGFRPFFLLAGLGAVILLSLWLIARSGLSIENGYFTAMGWHAHEMLFGYTAAVIAGFLLTAVRNWTGIDTPSGAPLALLAGLWLLGRLLPLVPGLPGVLIALVDIAFLPMVGVALARPIWRGANKVNRVILLILLVMTIANGLIHLDRLGLVHGMTPRGQYLMLDMVLLLIMMIAGRIVGFFTSMAIPGAASKSLPLVEKASMALIAVYVLVHLLLPVHLVTAIIALLLAALQAIRWWGWHDRRVWGNPMLWVLFCGYLWLITGFVLNGLSMLGLFPPNLVIHTFTLGVIGVFTLGMMARVALGHTGRPITSTASLTLAFVLLNAGVFTRVLLPFVWPAQYNLWVYVSGGLWLAAFMLFVIRYLPVLTRARIDGRPG